MTTATVEEVNEQTQNEAVQEAIERTPTMFETFWQENPLTVLEIDTAEIGVREQDNGRVTTIQADDKKLKTFIGVIEKQGQQQPIRVRLIDGRPFVAFGFRRYMACKALDRAVQCLPLINESEGDSDDLDAYTKNASENIQRDALGPIDMLRIFERMTAKVDEGGFGLGQKEVADRCGVSRPTVNIYLNNLSPLSPASKKLIQDGKVSASAAIELMGSKTMTPEQVDAELIKLSEAIATTGKKGGSVREVRKKTRKAAEEKGTGAKKQRTTKEIVGDLEEDVAGDTKGVKLVKAALLKYVKGGMSFDTFVKKIAEVV